MASPNPQVVDLDDAELVLVTGAAGHVGANVLHRLLADGRPVRVLLRDGEDNRAIEGTGVEVAYGDLRDRASLKSALDGVSHVFHVAAKVSTLEGTEALKREIFETNVLGTRKLLQEARRAGVERTVVTGTMGAIGFDLDDPSKPASEAFSFYPFHDAMPYEKSKVFTEMEVFKAAADEQDVVIATSCACVGGHDYWPSRLGKTIVDFSNGKLRGYTGGGFEFVCARDIADGHIRAMERGRTGHKYLFASEFKTIEDMVEIFAGITGLKKPAMKVPVTGMLTFSRVASFFLTRLAPNFQQRFTPGAIKLLQLRRRADITKARTELGYAPTAVRDAVREAYAFHHALGRIQNPKAAAPDFEPETHPAPALRDAA